MLRNISFGKRSGKEARGGGKESSENVVDVKSGGGDTSSVISGLSNEFAYDDDNDPLDIPRSIIEEGVGQSSMDNDESPTNFMSPTGKKKKVVKKKSSPLQGSKKIKKVKKKSKSIGTDSNGSKDAEGSVNEPADRSRSQSREGTTRVRSKSKDGGSRTRSRSRSKSRRSSDDDSQSRPVRSGKKKSTSTTDKDSPKKKGDGSKRTTRSIGDLSLDTMSTDDVPDNRKMETLKDENEALLEEAAILRRELNSMRDEMRKVKAEKNEYESNAAMELLEMQKELKAAKNEASDLRQEIDEYEEAIGEKDGLITKLTQAVDDQLDKVENLELKLGRAEEEFCKMEDEMKEMEDVIEELQTAATKREENESNNRHKNEIENSTKYNDDDDDDGDQEPELDERVRSVEEKERLVAKKEKGLQEREDAIEKEKKAVSVREEEVEKKMQEIDAIARDRDSTSEKEEKFKRELEVKNDELSAIKGEKISIESQLVDARSEVDALILEKEQLISLNREVTDNKHEMQHSHDEKIRLLREEFERRLKEADAESSTLRQDMEDLKQRQNARIVRPQRDTDDYQDENYVQELEFEISDLREKIVEQEQHARRQKEEIAAVFLSNEEIKQELDDREVELRDLSAQLTDMKEASAKKMAQKDDTITFMQSEMMRVMKEKQKADSEVREQTQKLQQVTQTSSVDAPQKPVYDEAAEMARIQAVNDQLKVLDEENRRLDETLKETAYKNQLRLKEKESVILDLQEELSDAKWELGARKEGADYITLLKDRKELKRKLDKTKKDLKKTNERIEDLEHENSSILSIKKDLEKEVEDLNKSVISMDSGEYVSGLKRQIKSLKQHNMTLERKIEVETREANEKIALRDAKTRVLEQELEKIKNPAQAAVRGLLSGFGNRESSSNTDAPKEQKHKDLESPKPTGGGGGLWKIFSPRKNSPQKKVKDEGILQKLKESDAPNADLDNKDVADEDASSDEEEGNTMPSPPRSPRQQLTEEEEDDILKQLVNGDIDSQHSAANNEEEDANGTVDQDEGLDENDVVPDETSSTATDKKAEDANVDSDDKPGQESKEEPEAKQIVQDEEDLVDDERSSPEDDLDENPEDEPEDPVSDDAPPETENESKDCDDEKEEEPDDLQTPDEEGIEDEDEEDKSADIVLI